MTVFLEQNAWALKVTIIDGIEIAELGDVEGFGVKLTLIIGTIVAIMSIVWAVDMEASKRCIPCGAQHSIEQTTDTQR